MIQAAGLTYCAGQKTLLSDVDFTLEAGRVLAVVGPNGAGKSTLLKCLSGELVPTKGKITWGARPLSAIPHHHIARCRAVLPQTQRPAFAFTAREVVLLGRSPHLITRESPRDHQIAQEALAATDTLHLAERSVQTLSGGELQRVHLARVLAQIWEPSQPGRLLLLDEPTSALDLKHQHHTLRLAREWAGRGVAVLVILHDLALAARYADEILWLRDGRTAACGPPRQTLTPQTIRAVFDIETEVLWPESRPPLLHALLNTTGLSTPEASEGGY